MRIRIRTLVTILQLVFCLTLTSNSVAALPAAQSPQNEVKDPNIILFYISNTWKALQRSLTDCNILFDPKTANSSILYLPADFPIPDDVEKLKQRCSLTIKRLPQKITRLGEVDGNKIEPAGLLYLPHPYIVPGGMFNEMYVWDSYFIVRGLLEAQKIELARGIAENFFFEIDHYGGILNGNRTYYLSRTQLPFLALIIRAVYEADQARNHADIKWLNKAYAYAVKDYELWTKAPHLAGDTGLSRYYDFGDGPVIELAQSRTYYSDVIRYFLLHPEVAQPYLLKKEDFPTAESPKFFYDVSLCQESIDATTKKGAKLCKLFKNIALTDHFYKGDRAMRESGFDTSFRFGPFSADTTNYVPVDLNSLLYKTEKDLEWMSLQLGNTQNALMWADKAAKRKKKINHYLWNEKQGLFHDYDFKNNRQSQYHYATTFYPLWAGVASKKQAKRLVENLKHFEKSGGIVTSLRETGVQWDYPYGWAPIQLITIEGLYRYHFNDDAYRLSHKFLMMVIKNYMRDKTIREKYNVVSGTSATNIQVGYKANVKGFGWTNGVFLVLLNKLPSHLAKNILGMNTPVKDESTDTTTTENPTTFN